MAGAQPQLAEVALLPDSQACCHWLCLGAPPSTDLLLLAATQLGAHKALHCCWPSVCQAAPARCLQCHLQLRLIGVS